VDCRVPHHGGRRHHLQSVDGPTDAGHGFWAIVAGAIWPIVLVGVGQMLAIHLITGRLRHTPTARALPVPALASDVAARF
jgi:hypothetical protein